jgi:S1-C subfamily serine protease
MTLIKKVSKTLCISLALMAGIGTITYATGNVEAVISGSEEFRNIIGFEMAETTPAQNVISGCTGVYVSAVIAGHPASAAGLKVGDIITKINGFAVADKPDALEVMEGLEAGRSYPFEVCRATNGQIQRLSLNILVEKVQEKAIAKIS